MPPKKTKPRANAKAPSTSAGNGNGAESQPNQQKSQQGGGKKENRSKNKSNNSSNNAVPEPYPPYWTAQECAQRYARKDPLVVRGKLRVLPSRDAASFVTCDRGFYKADLCVTTAMDRNRALDGDIVYVELAPEEASPTLAAGMNDLNLQNDNSTNDVEDEAGDTIVFQGKDSTATAATDEMINETWQDDAVQVNLWNPIVSVPRRKTRKAVAATTGSEAEQSTPAPQQRKARVVHILPPKSVTSEIPGDSASRKPARRRIVGGIKVLGSGTCLLTPNNKSLPQFKCPPNTHQRFENDKDKDRTLYAAEYEYLSWGATHKWPPCVKVEKMGKACVVEDEIQALLTENEVDHGDFDAAVLKNVDSAVESGLFLSEGSTEMNWKPTPDMYKGRRDYRKERIFTIDPTTAKDLDDALHVKQLPDGRVEIGVHIADVSFFIQSGTAVDQEAQKRATTVYLVDRTVPMLPRPLCEVACSLNENVERLAFSCVWTMNMDGTLKKKGGKVSEDDVWYGRTVIK